MPRKIKQPEIDHLDEETLGLLLQGFDDDELIELVANYEEIRDATQKLGPQSKEELWHYFKEKYDVELSTVAVCEGHTCQLDLVWEVYSFELQNVLWVLARGSGKTYLMAKTDETQCDFYPGFESFCVPLDAEILTERGWMKHDEVVVGDRTLGYNSVTDRLEWNDVYDVNVFEQRPTFEVGNHLWKARCTENHTWSVTRNWYTRGKVKAESVQDITRPFEEIRESDRVRLGGVADGGQLDITPTEAAVIGWLIGDGHCITKMKAGSTPRTYQWGVDRHEDFSGGLIWQSKQDGLDVLRQLLTDVPHKERPQARGRGVPEHYLDRFAFKLERRWIRDVVRRAQIGSDGLFTFVVSMSIEAREAFMDAIVQAEGWTMTDKRYAGAGTVCFAQNEGSVLDALVLCAYLCGYRPTIHPNDRGTMFNANAANKQVLMCRPYTWGGSFKYESSGEVEDVWCPTTDLGTWTMRWRGQILLTGNTIGPGKNQGERKYDHLLPDVVEGGVIGGKEKPHIARSVLTKTEWNNGSKMEISLGGEPENANGPRVPRLHRDELELMKSKTVKQAGMIPAGRMSRDGRYMPAQIVDTSTMKWAGGPIDVAIEAYNDALVAGKRPRQQVRISCIFEAAAENPTCRSVPADVRRARLIELDRDPDELCDCETYQSGDMPNEDPDAEPEPRTLDKVCQGRFFRSRGYKEFGDILMLFQEADMEEWDAELECSQPAREGAYLKAYNQIRSGIKGYEPDPAYGDIYTGTDWGGSDEHSHGWYQWLQQPAEVTMWKSGQRRVIPAGSVVRFAEIYKAQIGDIALGQRVQEMETEWMLKWPGWRVKERYVDVANLSARLNWRDQLGMATISRVKKDFDAEVKMVRALVGSRYWFIDIPACPWGDKALRAWKQVNNHEVHDWACLVAGTLVRTDAGNMPIEYVCAGDQVWTREGLKPVLWAGYTKTAETVVVDVESGKSLECTPDHRFWTDRGWVQAQDLTSNDMLLSWRSFERSECGSTSSTEDGASTDSPMHPDSPIVPTSRAVTSTFIEPSGRTSGERSPMGTRFTTETETSITISSVTSSLRASADTVAYMVRYLRALVDSRTSIESGPWHTQPWLERMYAPACAGATSIFGPGASRAPSSASTVTSPSSRPRCDRPSSARRLIDRLLGKLRGSMTSSVSARDAGRPSWSTSTSSSSSVPARVLGVRQSGRSVAVYDVCVDECHEFFADGVLVHNSHPMAELRYYESNRQVHVRDAARDTKRSQSASHPRAADEDRVQERQEELGNRVVVTYNKPREKAELLGVGAAADSPLMDERRGDRVLGGMPARERSRRGY